MKRQEYKKYSKRILALLEAKKILKTISSYKQFPDDPKIYIYSSLCMSSKKFADGFSYSAKALGCSFDSKELALFKCLAETMERFCQACYRDASITRSSFQDLAQEALDPTVYIENSSIRKKKFGWVKGVNLMKNTPCLIPAQLLFLNYQIGKEPILTEMNTTGSAGGFDHESTLLRALYEVVERDAFMAMYITKTPPKRIAIEKIKHNAVARMLESAARYNFDLILFDITSDIGIPTFLAAQIDRTGLGPSISLGVKSSLSLELAIIGSLQESFLGRRWFRTKLIKLRNKKVKIEPRKIHTMDDRGLYWAPLSMLEKLDFLFDGPLEEIAIKPFSLHAFEELEIVKDLIKKQLMDIFYTDITLKDFRELGFLVYKVLIPQLQMLVLDERNLKRSIRHERLKRYIRHVGRKHYMLNTVPQPFL